MKVEIKIDPDLTTTTAVIHTPKITPELVSLVEMLEETTDKSSLLTAKHDDKLFVIEPEQVEIVRSEGGEIKLYNRQSKEYSVSKPLHEIHERLGDNFVRISKSAIVNLERVDHLSNSFNGTMYIVMKNGINDYVSRKYWGDFKKRLGL